MFIKVTDGTSGEFVWVNVNSIRVIATEPPGEDSCTRIVTDYIHVELANGAGFSIREVALRVKESPQVILDKIDAAG